MEKKSRTGDSVFLKLPRMFLIMKTVFISLVCTLNVQANVFSQHTKFDIAMKNVTVSEVLCYLKKSANTVLCMTAMQLIACSGWM